MIYDVSSNIQGSYFQVLLMSGPWFELSIIPQQYINLKVVTASFQTSTKVGQIVEMV